MGNQEVVILPELDDALFELIELFYTKAYFGFLDAATTYVDDIYNFIYKIPTLQKSKLSTIDMEIFIVVTKQIIIQNGM
jgi:hypothetical protein